MGFNWGKKFTELQKKQKRLGTQRAVISRSFIAHAIDHSLDEYRDEVLEVVKGKKRKEEENLFAGTETIQGAYKTGETSGYNQALDDIITKLKEEK